MPSAVPRSRPWNSCAISASEVPNIIAPPTPCAARETFRKSGSGASPQARDEAVKIASPSMRRAAADLSPTTRRQHHARKGQRVGVDHPLEVAEVGAEVPLDGRQRDVTIVTSSSNMKIAMQLASRVHHLRSTGFRDYTRVPGCHPTRAIASPQRGDRLLLNRLAAAVSRGAAILYQGRSS
jgi:hypothetical protein